MTITLFHPILKIIKKTMKRKRAEPINEWNTSRAWRRTSTTAHFQRTHSSTDLSYINGVRHNDATIVSTALTTDAGSFLNSTKVSSNLLAKPLFWGQAHAGACFGGHCLARLESSRTTSTPDHRQDSLEGTAQHTPTTLLIPSVRESKPLARISLYTIKC